MNAYRAYRRHEPATGWTRADMLLALFDGALERMDKAEAALRAGNTPAALPLLAKTQLIITELAAGVRLDHGNEEIGANLLRLYEYAAHELREPRLEGIGNARKVLRTVREGFDAVRDEANRLERAGQLVTASEVQMVLTTA